MIDGYSVKQILCIVSDLNEKIITMLGDPEYPYPELTFTTNGYEFHIDFCGACIFSSENDERNYIEELDEYEPLDLFLNRKIYEYHNKTSKIKLGLTELGVSYGIGVKTEEGSFGMNNGPSPDIEDMLDVTGMDGSYIIIFPYGKPIYIWKDNEWKKL